MLQQVHSASCYNSLGSLEKCISSENSFQIDSQMKVGFLCGKQNLHFSLWFQEFHQYLYTPVSEKVK